MSPFRTPTQEFAVLETINKLLLDLPCKGQHEDGCQAYKFVLKYVNAEVNAAAERAALAKANSRARVRAARRSTDGAA